MKKTILLIALFFAFNISIGQNFKALDNYEFTSAESYKPAEKTVLECANYLFNNASNNQESNRLIAQQYIMKWMMGTPDYSFEIGSKSMELTKGNSDLLGLYMAAMSKVVIENTGDKLSNDQVYESAQEVLIKYCSNADNKMKPSKKMKQIIKSRKD